MKKKSHNSSSNNIGFPNLEKTLSTHFNIFIRESYGEQELEDIINALIKVENTFYVN